MSQWLGLHRVRLVRSTPALVCLLVAPRLIHFGKDIFQQDAFSLRNLIDNDMCGLHTPWQGVASTPLNAMPTRPSDDPRGGYRIDEPPLELPRLPEPYRTFSETFAY